MFARYRASSLVLCSLAILLLASACAPITSPNPPLSTPPAGAPASAEPGSSGSPAAGATPGAAVLAPAPTAAAVSSPAPTAPPLPAPTGGAAAPGVPLAFAARPGGGSVLELYIVDVPPTGAAPSGPLPTRQLTSDGQSSWWPVVSPDGRWIAYLVEPLNAAQPPQRDIWLISIDGQKKFNLTQSTASSFGPNWSPDGSQIAYASAGSIWVQDVAPILAGQAPAPRKLVDGGDSPVWSPDGTQIAYLAGDGQTTQLHTIKPNGTGQRQLTAHVSDCNGSSCVGKPAWQPDGRAMMVPMAFFEGKVQLVLLPVEGTTSPISDKDLRVMTPDEEYADMPAWEASGRWVAFRAGRDPNASIALIDMPSGAMRRIAPQLSGSYPVWSPDGSRLAFMVTGPAPDYKQHIYVTDRDGSNPLDVTDNPSFGFPIDAAWVPPNQRPK